MFLFVESLPGSLSYLFWYPFFVYLFGSPQDSVLLYIMVSKDTQYPYHLWFESLGILGETMSPFLESLEIP